MHDTPTVIRYNYNTNTDTPSIHSYGVFDIRIRYQTNSGIQKYKDYEVFAYSIQHARRKAGDIFRKEFPTLRLQ